MRALVTGATGFVGGHVARALAKDGVKVRALVRKDSGHFNALDKGWERAEGDVRDAASVREAVLGCDVVFHVAALYAFWPMDERPYYETNVIGTRNVMQAALDEGVQRVVHTSSWVTVGRRADGRLSTEADMPAKRELTGPYRKTKWLAEQEALGFVARGLDVVIAAPCVPVGPGDARPTPTGRIVLDFLRRRIPAYVAADLNLVAVEDVAQGHVQAWRRGRMGERYLLGAENITIGQMLTRLSAITGMAPIRRRAPYWLTLAAAYVDTFLEGMVLGQRPRIPLEGVYHAGRRVLVDCAKAREELGFRPTPVQGALKRAVAWYRENKYV